MPLVALTCLLTADTLGFGSYCVEGLETGIGYGPNDDLPGLVVLSDAGVGIVFDPTTLEENCISAVKAAAKGIPECSVTNRLTSWQRRAPETRRRTG